jgi:hypothetical protein
MLPMPLPYNLCYCVYLITVREEWTIFAIELTDQFEYAHNVVCLEEATYLRILEWLNFSRSQMFRCESWHYSIIGWEFHLFSKMVHIVYCAIVSNQWIGQTLLTSSWRTSWIWGVHREELFFKFFLLN